MHRSSCDILYGSYIQAPSYTEVPEMYSMAHYLGTSTHKIFYHEQEVCNKYITIFPLVIYITEVVS